MAYRIGASTIYGSILPNNKQLSRISCNQISKQARHRLRIIDYYRECQNVSLTCRHFGIVRSYFYKWYKRFNPRNLSSLEDRSRRPKTTRKVSYNVHFVALIRKLRKLYPSYSAKKLAVITHRDYDYTYSAATIGRIIKQFKLYFRAIIVAAKKRSHRAQQVWKNRKPYGLKTTKPRALVEFDMKHIYLGGIKQYAFVAVDVFTREVVIHVASRPSSQQAMKALVKTVGVFGSNIAIVNDNGSENLSHAYNYLKTHGMIQYFARPHTPKDKPHVENVIGKLQLECLDEHREFMTLPEREASIVKWLNDYHFFRPHQALNYLTPAEYCDTLGITILRREVSTM